MEDTIRFSENDLSTIEPDPWNYQGFVSVEFFPGSLVPVRVTNVLDEDFEDLLAWVDDGKKFLCADLEWCDPNRPCIFQIGSAKGALIIRHPTDIDVSLPLLNFLNTHKFYMKGMHMDRQKLREMYGLDLIMRKFKDIDINMLRPMGASPNFKKMVSAWASSAPCVQFKNKAISVSNWEAPILSKGQVLYAAFDVVALREVVKQLVPAHKKWISDHRRQEKEKRLQKKMKVSARATARRRNAGHPKRDVKVTMV